MLTFFRDHIDNFLHNPDNNYVFVWVWTLLLASFAMLAWIVLPSTTLSAVCIATYLILQGWRWYYDEWIENCLYPQDHEAIGNRAVVVNFRIAAFGAAAGILVSMLLGLMLKFDLNSTPLLLAYFIWIAAVPISFFNGTVKQALVYTLREVFGIPFDLAFFWMGLTTDEEYLDARYKKVNNLAKKLFAGISGYPSNLTLLHETDYIIRQLPTRR